VLQSSLVGLLPFSLDPNQLPVIWLLLPIAGLALLAYSKPAARLADVFLTGLLWLLPAGLFLFTQRPAVMYPYYAHFSLIGLALMVSLWVAALVEWIGRYRSQPILLIGLTVLLIVYAAISALNVFQGVRTAQSPALKQARYSEAAYDQITEFLDPGAYQEIVFLDTSEVMWWSMGKGVMIPVMFPGLTAHFDCYDGYLAQPGITTTPAILVLRMVSESEFKLVR